MLNQSIDSAKSKMEQTISFVKSEIGKIRTGRANTEMFNNILVNYYDNETPLNQVANIAALDAITISIQPFDKTAIDDIEKAILESDLGFNPSNNGNSIMIAFPPLSAERRQELVKVASKIVEDGRISVRNIRREIIQSAKRIEDEQNKRKSHWNKNGPCHAHRRGSLWKQRPLPTHGVANPLGRQDQGWMFAMSASPNVVSSRGRFSKRMVTCALFPSLRKIARKASKTNFVENVRCEGARGLR